jgi:hypothetical protein
MMHAKREQDQIPVFVLRLNNNIIIIGHKLNATPLSSTTEARTIYITLTDIVRKTTYALVRHAFLGSPRMQERPSDAIQGYPGEIICIFLTLRT